MGFSIINYQTVGVPPFMETAICYQTELPRHPSEGAGFDAQVRDPHRLAVCRPCPLGHIEKKWKMSRRNVHSPWL